MMYKTCTKLLLCIATLGTFSCSQAKEEHVVHATVFIHGIIKPYFTLKNILTIAFKNVENSYYATISNYFREQNFSRYAQATQERGLKQIDLTNVYTGSGAAATAYVFDCFNKFANPTQEHRYYTFGWSGLLSKKEREQAAESLYCALVELINEERKKGITLKLQLIGYSHGGNVALYLADIEARKGKRLAIDELMLLGTPIQADTDYLITNSMFGHIYNFYSKGDMVQTLDSLSTDCFIVQNRFKTRKGFIVPTNKVSQVEVQTAKTITRSCSYNDGTKGTSIIQSYHLNPGHIELWSFAWDFDNSYRKTLGLYPYPVVVFIPLMKKAIHQLSSHAQQDVILDIRIHESKITAQSRLQRCKIPKVSLAIASQKELTQMASHLEELFKPYKRTSTEYHELLQDALWTAFYTHARCS